MDCVEGIRLLPDNSVDLIIADPPYGVKYRSNFRKTRFNEINNDDTFLFDWIQESARVLKDGGALYCYTRWDVYPKWFEQISQYFKIKNTVVWYKRGGGLGDLTGAYIFNHEFIIYAAKGRHSLNGKRVNDVWEVPKEPPASYLHPTQKPVKLDEIIVEKSSSPGDVVLVPFTGGGSECIAAAKLGRKFIGFETDPQYIEIANKRLDGLI
jgi:DNA modification methylase